jgi:hypothetical protein
VQFNGEDHYQGQGTVLVPISGSGVAVIMMRRDGGVIGGMPAIEKGEPGLPAELSEIVNHSSLAYDDPTAESASITTLTPPTSSSPGVYRLNLATRRGAPGDDGVMQWDPADLAESPVAGQIPAVNSTADGFDLVPDRIPEVFFPASINNVGTGNPSFTQAVVAIPARPWVRRIRPVGFTVVTGESADVRVDLVARLNGELAGNIIGRCPGVGQVDRLVLIPGKTPANDANFDTIAAGATATVHFRTERTAGSVTYTAPAVSSQYSVEVLPV